MVYQSDEGKIFYAVHGTESSPVLVFTHGAGLDHHMFDGQVEALKDRFRIIVWDMPGHGESAALTDTFDFVRMADHVVDILDELGIKQAAMVGQSLGSWVSQHLAVTYPERVTAVVSIGGLPLQHNVSLLEIFLYRVTLLISRLMPAKMLFRWTAKSKAVTAPAQAYAEQAMQRIGKQQFLLIVAGMLQAGRLGITAIPSQPLLITHGQHEMPASVAKRCAAWHMSMPESTYAVLPDAGHNANVDNPGAFNAALVNFLEAAGLT